MAGFPGGFPRETEQRATTHSLITAINAAARWFGRRTALEKRESPIEGVWLRYGSEMAVVTRGCRRAFRIAII